MFSNAVKLLTLNRFDIKVDPSWLIIAALITWSLSKQYFPATYPGQGGWIYLAMGLAAMLGFFMSLLLHELSHSIVARRFGLPIKGITLFLFGGVAEMEQEPQTASVELWVALAGPAMSLMLAFGFWVLAGVLSIIPMSGEVVQVMSYLAAVNLVLAIFNLVPAFPLDGGRVLRAYLWQRSGDILKATEIASKWGAAFAYVLMGQGIFSLFQGAQVAGLWQLLIGAFLLFAARGSYQNQLARTVFADKTVRALMVPNPVTVSPERTLSELVNLIMLRHRVSFVPVVENDVLLGHIDTAVLGGLDRENWANTRVGDVFVGLTDDVTVDPDMAVQDLMSRIAKHRQRKFLVVEDQRLLGVITLVDLLEYLNLSQQLERNSMNLNQNPPPLNQQDADFERRF